MRFCVCWVRLSAKTVACSRVCIVAMALNISVNLCSILYSLLGKVYQHLLLEKSKGLVNNAFCGHHKYLDDSSSSNCFLDSFYHAGS